MMSSTIAAVPSGDPSSTTSTSSRGSWLRTRLDQPSDVLALIVRRDDDERALTSRGLCNSGRDLVARDVGITGRRRTSHWSV